MGSYVLTKVSRLGEHDEKYGQRFWCNVEGYSYPVSFNALSGDYSPGDKINYEEAVVKETKKGTEYRQLKKVRPQGSTPKSNGSGNGSKQFTKDDNAIRAQWAIGQAVQVSLASENFSVADVETRAKELFGMVDRVKDSTEKKVVSESQPPVEAYNNVDQEENYDEPINLDDIPF